jgi:hypothetical protein
VAIFRGQTRIKLSYLRVRFPESASIVQFNELLRLWVLALFFVFLRFLYLQHGFVIIVLVINLFLGTSQYLRSAKSGRIQTGLFPEKIFMAEIDIYRSNS